ncbi:MAG: endolytic transglycosylase MltG [Candidatus Kerfeldbacteria bacterium]|nr:endolytic transglycosylase MltG [Candidatus Kerfeldbacteria bacterium]
MRYFYAALVTAVFVVAGTWWWMAARVGHAAGSSSTATTFVVSEGEQLRSVAVRLESERLIQSAPAWTLYTILQGQRSAILAGSYELDPTMTGREILATLTKPLKDTEVKVTIPEGLTNQEVAALLEKSEVIAATNFMAAVSVKDSREILTKEYAFLLDKPATADLQGYLFPDTYRFFKHSSASDVLQKFLDNFDARVSTSLRQSAQAQGRTLFEELTMASILEKELTTDADRAMGADVFWKRLAIGMPLQSDATVNFVTGKSKLQPSNADTNVDSPYNTYQNKGLPPGPINNPGISALRAAINPTSNPYYYYLTAGGKTYFSKTLEEHNEYKRRYLQ